MSGEPLKISDAPPRDLCGYAFARWLKPGRTALCRNPQGRAIVLKSLDDDCLLEGQLHPDIKERLARIRELPHRTIATLISVERDPEGAVWAVWEFVDGESLQEWASEPTRDDRQVARMLRELAIAVGSMHGHGIIHGALHAGNILVDRQGQVRLLDASPLLFNDEQEDAAAISSLIGTIVSERKASHPGSILEQAAGSADLHEMSATISRAIQAGEQSDDTSADRLAADRAEHRARRHAMRWALISAAAAAALAFAGWAFFADHGKAPPEAPSEALVERQ